MHEHANICTQTIYYRSLHMHYHNKFRHFDIFIYFHQKQLTTKHNKIETKMAKPGALDFDLGMGVRRKALNPGSTELIFLAKIGAK